MATENEREKEKINQINKLLSTLPKPFNQLSEDEQIEFAKQHYMEISKALTPPLDPRFAATVDQSKSCWINYNEALKCLHLKGETQECRVKYILAVKRCGSYKMGLYTEAQNNGQWWGYPWPHAPKLRKLPWENQEDDHHHKH